MPVKEAMKVLRKFAAGLTRNELMTLRGQILAGDTEGAMRGIETILRRRGA